VRNRRQLSILLREQKCQLMRTNFFCFREPTGPTRVNIYEYFFVVFYSDNLSLAVDPSRATGVIACLAAIMLTYVDMSLMFQ
jgi:hypothetical protein